MSIPAIPAFLDLLTFSVTSIAGEAHPLPSSIGQYDVLMSRRMGVVADKAILVYAWIGKVCVVSTEAGALDRYCINGRMTVGSEAFIRGVFCFKLELDATCRTLDISDCTQWSK